MSGSSECGSDSDDSFLEKQMDMYLEAKKQSCVDTKKIDDALPQSNIKPKAHSDSDSDGSLISSSDDSYIENYINKVQEQQQNKNTDQSNIRLQGTTVRQDLSSIPVNLDGQPNYFADYSCSSSDNEDNFNDRTEHNTENQYEYIEKSVDAVNCIEKPVDFNNLTIETLIYPTNYPIREYQRKITETCIKNNTLVAIPTGTGKTFIAATIMLNFFRWFCLKDNQKDIIKIEEDDDQEPLSTKKNEEESLKTNEPLKIQNVKKKKSIKELLSNKGTFDIEPTGPVGKAKIVFVAPTRPLVAQIIQACLGITGIPAEHVCILLDKKPKERVPLYQTKSVFIGTPQIIERDLYNGVLSPHDIKLLIIDECHKSTGNFSYVKIVDYVNRFCKNNFRIIGLSATPTNSVEGLENIVNNLQVSKIELRTEDSPDLKKYMKNKDIVETVVYPNDNHFIEQIIECISPCVEPLLRDAIRLGIYPSIAKPAYINAFIAMENKRKVIDNPNLSEGLKWHQFFILSILYDFGFLMQKLNSFGIRTFYHCFLFKKLEFDAKFKIGKTKNKQMIQFYNHENINECLESCKTYLYKSNEDPSDETNVENFEVSTHPKFDKLLEELYDFFEENCQNDSKVIIFSSFRDVALEIIKTIDAQNDSSEGSVTLSPHIFIGQSSGKKAFDPETFILENSTKRTSGFTKKQREMKLKQIEEIKKAEKEILKERREDSRVQSSEEAQISGMTQPQQKKVIEDFKMGKHNILVCTSIGEEGLDIGEVDLIIFFDATASLVRNIQRMGRTGRKRDGKVVLLLTKREMTKFKQSFEEYEKLQNEIQLYGDEFLKYSCDMYPKDRSYKIKYAKIVIEEESEKLTEIDDVDKVIVLGTQVTQYSTNSMNRTNQKNKNPGFKKKKPPKVFNYPNNVDADKPPGFMNVGNMLQKVIKNNKNNNTGLQNKRNLKQVAFVEEKTTDLPKLGNASKFQKVKPGPLSKVAFADDDNNNNNNDIIELSE
ncbi:hypothetical protein ACO0SA_004881 [Hanseniaspora valbyensis]